jgi:hypothetical protein
MTMDEAKPQFETGAVPIIFCDEKKKWLPVEKHMDCENCAAAVFDENDDAVSFICTRRGEKRVIQKSHVDPAEEGRGAPADPDAFK